MDSNRPARPEMAAIQRGAQRVIALVISGVLAATACLAQTPVDKPAPAGKDGWVVLPVDQYRLLHEAAFPRETKPLPPPVDATLTRVDYQLAVEGDVASGEAQLAIDVIKEGWVRVPIPQGLMIHDARIDGRPVSLITESEKGSSGVTSLLLSRTGRTVLTLGIVAPVTSVAGTDILQLPVGASAVSRAVITLPRKDVDVKVSGGLLLEKSDTANQSRWAANGLGNQPLIFSWKRRLDDSRAIQPLRMRAALTQLIGLGEDSTQVNAEVLVEVLQGQTTDVRVQLPPQFVVNQVSGGTVADWDASATELTVTFIDPVTQSTRFSIIGEVRLARDGKIDVPLLRVPKAERETGGAAVEVLGAGEIQDRRVTGLIETEAAELGQLISSRQSPSLMAFRFQPADGASPRALNLTVARYTTQAILTANIDEARYSVLSTREGKTLVQMRLAVRNNQRSFLKLALPPGAVLWSAMVAGRPIKPGKGPDGSLLVPLEKGRASEDAPAFSVEIDYLDAPKPWTDKGKYHLTLASVDLPISRSGLLVHYSPLFKVTPVSGVFRPATYQEPESPAFRVTTTPDVTLRIAEAEKTAAGQRAEPDQMASQLKDYHRAFTPTRNTPIRIAFPHLGPSIYMVAELTGENQAPAIDLDYLKDQKRGEK